MRHRLALILVSVGTIGVPYFAWALHRVSDAVLVGEMSWPLPWPYPDRWLAALNDWYDARSPSPPDTIKLHGEFPRVRVTIGLALVGCLFWAAAGATLVLIGHARRSASDA